jgi:hypothetical protein
VRKAIRDVSPRLLLSFENALNLYDSARGGVAELSAAALEMRNLIDGAQGVLFEKARKWPKENMTWDKMAERLCVHEFVATVVDESKVHANLVGELSNMLKHRTRSDARDLQRVWTVVVDHLYVILTSIKNAPS